MNRYETPPTPIPECVVRDQLVVPLSEVTLKEDEDTRAYDDEGTQSTVINTEEVTSISPDSNNNNHSQNF